MTRLRRLDAPLPFELWLVDLDAVGEALPDTLDAEERARAARFVFERDRARFIAAHRALRHVLALRTGRSAMTLRFENGSFGKPHLLDAPGCAFSLSHSAGTALIAMSADGEIGVDVEVLRPADDRLALAQRHFTASEQRVLAATDPGLIDAAFLRVWTRKEACVKALGAGLQVPTESFEVGLDPHERQVTIAAPGGEARVIVQSAACGSDLVAAVARVSHGP
jgi:4'-phosphopantetheinyl transferase